MKLHPGVYIEEVPSGSAPVEATSTSIALIAGYATKGPTNTPTLLFNFDQYTQQFGGINDYFGSTLQPIDYIGHVVQAFFNNGGTQAYIIRVDGTGSGSQIAFAKMIIPVASVTDPANINHYLNIHATSSGAWANGMQFRVVSNGATPARYTVTIGWLDRQGNFVASEKYTDVSLGAVDGSDDGPDFVVHKLNGVSKLVQVDSVAISTIPAPDKAALMVGSLTGGDISGLRPTDYTWLTAAPAKGFTVKLNGATTGKDVAFTGTPTTLADLATQIQAQVNAGAAAGSAEALFTCKVENLRLVLRSNLTGAASAVVLAPPTTSTNSAIGRLKLDIAAPAPDTAVALNGSQAFMATFSNSSTATLTSGQDGTSLPGQADYAALLPQLKKYRDISIILLPGLSWSGAAQQAIISLFVGHAELMGNRMVIIDPPVGTAYASSVAFNAAGFPTSTYTAAYYPWLEVANPWYEAELRPNRSPTVMIPPSGFAAGLWAKTDAKRGVWKAPAGLQASLLGAANTQYVLGDDEQDQLNPVGLNCYRRIISDIVVWGSRTLATKADPEWRYVPVRRTAMMLEESIYQGIQWAVFEPNDHRLWSSLRLNIGAFMDSLFRAGAFQGEKASDAYFVRCALDDTMTQGDIDAGQVIVLVGFAPLKPAEFVVVKIQQIVGKS